MQKRIAQLPRLEASKMVILTLMPKNVLIVGPEVGCKSIEPNSSSIIRVNKLRNWLNN